MGRIAGECAAAYCGTTDFAPTVADHPTVLDRQAFYSAMMDRTNGSSWKELNIIINQLLDDYCPVFQIRSAGKFEAGLGYFQDLRKLCSASVQCKNAHELMRAVEAFDLLDIGEAMILSARARKETRGLHRRPDFPFTNPLLNNHFVTITKTAGGPQVSIRPAQAV